MKTLKDIVAMALKNEEEGAKFYRKTAKEAGTPLVASTFQFLAEEEDKHVHIFREYIEQNVLEKPSDLKKYHITSKDGIKKLFNKTAKLEIKVLAKKGTAKPEIYDKAMEMEQKSYNLYSSAMLQIKNEKEKKLLEFLAQQEAIHYQILQESKEYLDTPGDWFAKEERWMQT